MTLHATSAYWIKRLLTRRPSSTSFAVFPFELGFPLGASFMSRLKETERGRDVTACAQRAVMRELKALIENANRSRT